MRQLRFNERVFVSNFAVKKAHDISSCPRLTRASSLGATEDDRITAGHDDDEAIFLAAQPSIS
jgi:hypothetical protein